MGSSAGGTEKPLSRSQLRIAMGSSPRITRTSYGPTVCSRSTCTPPISAAELLSAEAPKTGRDPQLATGRLGANTCGAVAASMSCMNWLVAVAMRSRSV
jgi:hypothetical protein